MSAPARVRPVRVPLDPPAPWLSASLAQLLGSVFEAARSASVGGGELEPQASRASVLLGGERPACARLRRAELELSEVHRLELARALRLAACVATSPPLERGPAELERAVLEEAWTLALADQVEFDASVGRLVERLLARPARAWPRAARIAALAFELAPCAQGRGVQARAFEAAGELLAASVAYALAVRRAPTARVALAFLAGLARVQRALGCEESSRALERELDHARTIA